MALGTFGAFIQIRGAIPTVKHEPAVNELPLLPLEPRPEPAQGSHLRPCLLDARLQQAQHSIGRVARQRWA